MGKRIVRMKGLEPPRRMTLDPKSNAATNYATCAELLFGRECIPNDLCKDSVNRTQKTKFTSALC